MKTQMLSFRRKSVVGLDIDASAVRMVQVRKDGTGYIVTRAAVSEVAPWGNDPDLRRIHTVQAIVHGLSSSGIDSKVAVCGLRGPEVVVRDFEFPALPPEEIEGAVQLEVSQICPFLAEESTLDYQVTSNTDKKTMGFWVAATNLLIENTRQLVSEAGLHCALVDVAGLALLNLLEAGGPKTADKRQLAEEDSPSFALGNAVLDVGEFCATMAIMDHASRPFVRDIGGGAFGDGRQSLAASRSRALGGDSFPVEGEWATRSDHRSGTNDSLDDDIATTLRYYAAQNDAARVDRLLVCGGSAATEDLVQLLRSKLNIEVEPWNPLAEDGWRMADGGWEESIDADPKSEIRNPRLYGSSLAVAAGLAMRHV
jgi:type IV pilus assembly protein PilM